MPSIFLFPERRKQKLCRGGVGTLLFLIRVNTCQRALLPKSDIIAIVALGLFVSQYTVGKSRRSCIAIVSNKARTSTDESTGVKIIWITRAG